MKKGDVLKVLERHRDAHLSHARANYPEGSTVNQIAVRQTKRGITAS